MIMEARTKIVHEGSTSTQFQPEESMMRDAAESLDFEKAIALREQIKKLNTGSVKSSAVGVSQKCLSKFGSFFRRLDLKMINV
ncbi:MAG: UvrB/UvrC motif-containing protein [Methanoregula sp.]|uniref:UvrB/UvrC motif-containing protein n=1 Tax=Methanoregula sp. TaxID=2052170 RepID=UPI0025CBA6BB|nr:UvrB/UvrC motif-containing protein [Methanoregula sp.]MCK9632172.1 UvrB/UvrC motif-containing protein [Methanoregula sp.]